MDRLKSSLGGLTKLGRHDTYKPRIPLSKGYPSAADDLNDPTARQHLAPGDSSGGGTGRKLRASHRDPFAPGARDDAVAMEEPSLGRVTIALLSAEVFLAFIAMCCLAGLAAFQSKWKIGVSGLVGWSLTLSIALQLLALLLLLPPVIFDRYDRLGTLVRFLKERRSQYIFQGVGMGASLVAAVQMTASAWSQKACRNPEIDPHSYFGDEFMTGLIGWCRTKKATGIFFWMIFATWLANLIMYIILSRREAASSPLSRYQSTRNPGLSEYATSDSPRFVSNLPATTYDTEPKPAAYMPTYASAPRDEEDDAYAADADGDVGYVPLSYDQDRRATTPRAAEAGKPLSRTMQLAKTDYADPYAQVTAALSTPPPPAPSYVTYASGTPPYGQSLQGYGIYN